MKIKHGIAGVVLTALLMGCGGHKSNNAPSDNTEHSVGAPVMVGEELMLLGAHERSALQQPPFANWYETTYEEYKPDTELLQKLKPLTTDLEITVFMGTWCEDSQREVPAFFKILDALDFPEDKLTVITMDREKTTPQNLEEGLDIIQVPTMIFRKNGKELNRIVEFPIETLEKDMYKILSGQDYKNAYAW